VYGRLRTVVAVSALTVAVAACSSPGGTTDLPAGPAGATSSGAPAATASPAAADDQVLSAYRRFWAAVIAANRAADAGSPGLAAVAADPELSRVRATVSRNKIQKLSLRGEVAHTPKPPTVSGTTATLEDCYDISDWNPVSVTTGKPIEVTDESGTGRYRARYTLRRSGAGWLVVDQKALGGC
jgi:hypothetical protein